jgi:CubicO group peptidase (beta-lactamase class C family)
MTIARMLQGGILAGCLALLAATAANAQELAGRWTGQLQLPQGSLRLVFNVDEPTPGAFTGTVDSPDQGATGIPVSAVTFDGGRVRLEVKAVRGYFEGSMTPDGGRIVGDWVQGQSTALTMFRNGTGEAPAQEKFSGHVMPSDDAIRALLKRRVEARKYIGVVVGVIDGDRQSIISYGTFGANDRRAVGPDTLFEIGSVTKVFTSLLLADAVSTGAAKLEDPVSAYLPAHVKVPTRSGDQVTLLELATHSSGLPSLPINFTPKDMSNPYLGYTTDALFTGLSKSTFRSATPSWEYSNFGTALLGHGLAHKAGMSFEALVKKKITGPLAMTDTSIQLRPDQKARLAIGHDEELAITPNWDLPALEGAGAMRSTAADMLKFLQAQLGAPKTALQKAMHVQRTPRRSIGLPTGEQALGWMVRKSSDGEGEVLWHNGATGGYRAFLALNPTTNQGVVVLSNVGAPGGVNDIGFHLLIDADIVP